MFTEAKVQTGTLVLHIGADVVSTGHKTMRRRVERDRASQITQSNAKATKSQAQVRVFGARSSRFAVRGQLAA